MQVNNAFIIALIARFNEASNDCGATKTKLVLDEQAHGLRNEMKSAREMSLSRSLRKPCSR
jgi:hypothetical protein